MCSVCVEAAAQCPSSDPLQLTGEVTSVCVCVRTFILQYQYIFYVFWKLK